MTQLISSNLPVFFQCYRIPSQWRLGKPAFKKFSNLELLGGLMAGEPAPGHLSVRDLDGAVTTYDPWEKRDEFFRLKEEDTEGLLKFLGTVGLFERAEVLSVVGEQSSNREAFPKISSTLRLPISYLATFRIQAIWTFRRLIENSLKGLDKHTGESINFQSQIVRIKGRPHVNVTTATFKEALLLTLSVDRVLKAKVRKCTRPDCPVTFSFTSGHRKKYCSWECGHLESVRRQRRKAKSTQTVA